jgi:hypothetical protein
VYFGIEELEECEKTRTYLSSVVALVGPASNRRLVIRKREAEAPGVRKARISSIPSRKTCFTMT